MILYILIFFIILLAYNYRYILPKHIWVYWDTPRMPDLIQKIQNYNQKRLDRWTIHYLNNENLHFYIDQSEYPQNYESILLPQHKSDWIRLCILNKYGGCWLDASIIINDVGALDKLYMESIQQRSQFTGFSLSNKYLHGVPLYIENWFIMAPKNSTIIKAWLKEFELAIHKGFRKYKKDIIDEGVNVKSIYNSDDDVYLTMHACLQAILQKRFAYTPSILIKPAENDMFRLLKICSDRPLSCVMENIRDNPYGIRTIPYIKLTKGMRDSNIDISRYFE